MHESGGHDLGKNVIRTIEVEKNKDNLKPEQKVSHLILSYLAVRCILIKMFAKLKLVICAKQLNINMFSKCTVRRKFFILFSENHIDLFAPVAFDWTHCAAVELAPLQGFQETVFCKCRQYSGAAGTPEPRGRLWADWWEFTLFGRGYFSWS